MRLTSSGQPGDVIGLDVGLDHGGDLRALRLRGGDVVVDEVRVGVDHCELARRLTAEQIRGAGRLVVQELTEVHEPGPP